LIGGKGELTLCTSIQVAEESNRIETCMGILGLGHYPYADSE